MKRGREETLGMLTLSFVPLLLSNYICEWKHLIKVSHKIYDMYYKIFVQHAKWPGYIPPKAVEYIVRGVLYCQSNTLDRCRLTQLTSICNEFFSKPYCSLLTSLTLLGPISDYSALNECSQLIECTVHLHHAHTSLIIPPSVTQLTMKGHYHRIAPLGPFPPNLTSLKWDWDQLELHKLPSTLTSLETNCIGLDGILPKQLLRFQCNATSLSDITLMELPPKLTQLEFYYNYKNTPNNFFPFLPTSLISLHMNGFFHISICLPPNLTELSFGNNFDEPIPFFPNSLKRVYFGEIFNQTINHLPNQLEELTLGMFFKQSLNHLPNGLTKLVLNCEFCSVEECISLPNSIQEMKIKAIFIWQRIQTWPQHLTRLDLRGERMPYCFAPCTTSLSRLMKQVLIIVEDCNQYYGSHVRCTTCLHKERNCFLPRITSQPSPLMQ